MTAAFPRSEAKPSGEITRTDFAQCMLCEALCGLEVEHDGRTVTRIRGDAQHVFSRGHICPKGVALQELQNDPDRLRQPMKRVAARSSPGDDRAARHSRAKSHLDDFEPIGWDEALALAGRRFAEIQQRHGRDALAMYFGNPAAHSYSAILFYQQLVAAAGSKNRYSANSIDTLPRFLTSYEMYGNQVQVPVPDVDRTDYFLMLGANPLVSNGSAMTAPDIEGRLRKLRARGGKLVVLDPRRTETAVVADEHHFIRPGTDALFLAALLNVLSAEGLARPGHLLPHLDRWGDVLKLFAPYTPDRVAHATGVPAATIVRLARELAAAPTAVCYGRMGTSVQEFGTLATWLTDLVNIATGNLDRPGGWMFTTPAFDLPGAARTLGLAGTFDRFRSRVSGYPEFTGEFPVAALAEEIDTPGEGQVRALVVMAGNPVLSCPNGRRLDRALESLEFMVSIDIYVNETSRHADLILPTTFGLEHAQYSVLNLGLAVRNTAHWSPAILEKPAGLRHDWEVLLALAEQLEVARGGLSAVKGRLRGAFGRAFGAKRILDVFLRLGPHRLSVAKLERAPHGVDLGALGPRLAKLMGRRKVRVAPPRFVADLARLEARLATAGSSLVLVSRRTLRSNNSWNHNSPRLVSGRDRCTLQIHPDDAASRGIATGQRVALKSRVGEIVVPIVVTDAVMRGVVSLPHGWGHDRAGVQMRVASGKPGASVNDVTDEAFVDALSGTSSFSGVPVEVTKVEPSVAAS